MAVIDALVESVSQYGEAFGGRTFSEQFQGV